MYDIAIVGASGLVGRMFLKGLEEYNIKISNLTLYASRRSAGKKLIFKDKEYEIIELKEDNIGNHDFALFSAGGKISERFAKIFTQKGTVVIDNSSYYRMYDSVPLLVPEVNMDSYNGELLIANPNCSTIQTVVLLKALEELEINRVIVSTYQAVSGSGRNGINDLKRTLKRKNPLFYPYAIANNCIPQIDKFSKDGYTYEEEKMINETKKIMDINLTATCVRVPITNSHSISVNIQFNKEFDIEDVKNRLKRFPGIMYYEEYPVNEMSNDQDYCLVGRVRRDYSQENTLHLWCVADNIRKGAAINAVQILDRIIKEKL
ncbi:aspartate-semialdehyde dehydrogenase [Mycoplasmatota bacterium]|nr:aspartate-semialdehyde dehydrogenase [Mycoplasmatota bacterium]